MKILGLDTTTKILSISTLAGARICEYNLELGRKLSSLLELTIKRVLDASSIDIKGVDYFACGIGPGSFTGVRLGVASVKAMAWALNKPVIGIPTLDILAQGIGDKENPIVSAIDAKRDLIYCCIYKNKNGFLKKTKPFMLLDEKEFLSAIPKNSLVLGDAVPLYKESLLSNIPGIRLAEKDYWYPKAHNVITLALRLIKDNKLTDSFGIKPIYLYSKECQIRNR